VTRALVIVDHGSRRAEANAQLEAVADLVRARLPGWIVRAAHMELASPSVDEAIDACVADGATEIVVHPYFLAPGNHSAVDIPVLARRAGERHPGASVRVTEPLGLDERIAEIVVARALAAARE
jgi:sirohydrochlorin ferrochelatase